MDQQSIFDIRKIDTLAYTLNSEYDIKRMKYEKKKESDKIIATVILIMGFLVFPIWVGGFLTVSSNSSTARKISLASISCVAMSVFIKLAIFLYFYNPTFLF
ncbi:hypothetical protein DFA_03072 [Cavenderia fasciculata]|uniref:Uncharacterized protein n=1 Tax=Cavenderia fasciculata TaxID=261658 RepID=F4PGJ3_CACFS|nr:uncharacterized protein DFA_03072 [Cavenderia fasciculata]EGG24827.1 hypothetical protein DFA_03072 [Cavenderia fasciculata]|eukprot:XP_004362678.1 hypothetical protein DFA_03072 [Cavenderia fasciculata]